MLQSFTWQHFLVAALVLSSIWYVIILLVFYRDRFRSWGDKKNSSTTPEPLKHYWDNEEEFDEFPEEGDLLGKSKLPEGISSVSMGDLGFVQNEKEEQLGLVPDVIEEIKTIFSILAKEDGNKSDFFSLFQLVKAKYSKIGASPLVNDINKYIQENAPFHLSKDELENLWD